MAQRLPLAPLGHLRERASQRRSRKVRREVVVYQAGRLRAGARLGPRVHPAAGWVHPSVGHPWLRWPDLASKNTEHLVKSEFHAQIIF